MTLIQALVLGLVQGITEFLPISSDGHLVLTQHLLGIQTPPVAFDIVVHSATLIVIIISMWPSLTKLTPTYLKHIAVATLPTGLIGLFLNRYIDFLYSSLLATAAGFIVTSIFLWFSRLHRQPSLLNYKSALFIGLMQGLAVLPGVSRSGTTISTALLLGLSGQQAFTFSFLAAIPAILGAQAVGLSKLGSNSLPLSIYLSGSLMAAVTGFFSIKLLKNIVSQHHFHRFAIYTTFIALVTLLVLS